MSTPNSVAGQQSAGDHRRWVCQEIARDAEADVHRFEGAPFDGRTVAEYLGGQSALIAALAKVVESLLPPKSSAEPPAIDDPVALAAAHGITLDPVTADLAREYHRAVTGDQP